MLLARSTGEYFTCVGTLESTTAGATAPVIDTSSSGWFSAPFRGWR